MRKFTSLKMVLMGLFVSIGTISFSQTTDLLISEYAEGSSGNSKYVEIYNGTGVEVDLANYRIWTIANGGSWPEGTLNLSGKIAHGATFVIANNATDVPGADLYNTNCNWNGDDAVGLAKNISETWTLIDAVGTDGSDPGTGWAVAGTTDATKDKRLTRKPTVCSPTTNWSISAGTTESDSQWIIENYVSGAANSGHTANCSSTPTVALPTFSISAGNYTSTQNIVISSTTSGAEIHYTTDGSTPTASSTLYTTPIAVSTTTTIKAIAIKSGMDNSSVASATYTFPTEVATIAALRAASHPGFYKLTGESVLTLKSSSRNAKYIQDATAAVVIDDASGKITTNYNLGDGITGIVGTTAVYNGMLQLTPVADPGVATSTGKSITPALVEITDLVNHPAQLVRAKNVTIDATGNFAASTTYNLVGSTSVVIRTQYADLDYVANTDAIPTSIKDIVGVVLIYNSTTQLIPRSTADFLLATSVNNPSSKSGIYALNGNIVLTAEAGDVVEVFSASGQRLVSVKAVAGENRIPVAAKGVVLVRTKGQMAKVAL